MRKIITILIIIMSITNIVSADTNTNESLLKPGMGMDWYNAQPQDFKDLVWWCLGGVVFAFGAIFVISTLGAGGKGMLQKGGFENPEEQARSNTAIFGIFLIAVGVMIFIAIGTGFFKWF